MIKVTLRHKKKAHFWLVLGKTTITQTQTAPVYSSIMSVAPIGVKIPKQSMR